MDDYEASCGYCRRKSSHLRRCNRCLNVHYCSKACQTMDWLGHKVKCVKLSHTGKRTTQKLRRTGNETLSANNETEGNGIQNKTNTSKSRDTDTESVNAHGESSPDRFPCTIDAGSNFETKMKTEYSTFEEHIKHELRGNGTESEKVVVSSFDSEDAKQKNNNVESKLGNDEKDKDPTTSEGVCDQKKMSGSFTNLCICCSLPGCSQKCSRCKEAFYCSQECQRKDWPTHKTSCSVESKLENDVKDRNPTTSIGDCDQKKMSGSFTNLCICCSLSGCSQKCSRCKEAFYCSQECQRKDWPTHKTSCSKKLTEEEEKIKAMHEKLTKEKEKHQQLKDKYDFFWTTHNFEGPGERFHEMLTLEQALYRATRPPGSLQKAIRQATIFFPLFDIVTQFDKIPWEPMFPFFPFMFPPRGGYVLVAFMYRYHEHVMRHGVYLKDEHDKESKVEFYFDHIGDNPFPFFRYSQVKPGGYICLADPVMHMFGDGTVGIRINNPHEVKVLDIEMVMT